MNDNDCVRFLQWALPQMNMRWPGFRRVRRQVCKRIERHVRALQLPDVNAYRDHLLANKEEWSVLDVMCRVTISRFYRDKRVFAELEQVVLPRLAKQALARGAKQLRVWSVGCASGEEPYTLSMLWQLILQQHFPELELHILATDIDEHLLARADVACYEYGSIKNLPEQWREACFISHGDDFCLQPALKDGVTLQQHDVRDGIPDGPFHLVMCRNLVFTYFEQTLQLTFLERLQRYMPPGGVLLLGVHESLPEQGHTFTPRSSRLGIYEKTDTGGEAMD